MQVTTKLAALYIQALQAVTQYLGSVHGAALCMVSGALTAWMDTAEASTSLQSRAAASVRQQLQVSGLLQHLATAMDAAAARLTAMADAGCSSRNSSASSSSHSDGTAGTSPALQLSTLDSCCQLMLRDFTGLTSWLSSAPGRVSLQAALPAAPAALRLVLTVFQTHHRLQQLQQQQPDGGSYACTALQCLGPC